MATSTVARCASPSSFPTASMLPPASRHATLIFLGAAARDVHCHQGGAASQGRGNAVGVTPRLQRSEHVARRRGRGLVRSYNAITFTPLRDSGSNTTLDRNYLDRWIRIVSPLRNHAQRGRARERGRRGTPSSGRVGSADGPPVPVDGTRIVCIVRRIGKLSVERK
jgi:hypothetical protein